MSETIAKREARKAREIHTGTIELVDYRNRTVATINLHGNATRELHAAIARWRKYAVAGGYARDECGKMLDYF